MAGVVLLVPGVAAFHVLWNARPLKVMPGSSPHSQNAAASRGGAGQTVVELRSASGNGLVFWSRQRFETGAELQARLRAKLLPKALRQTSDGRGWVNLRGFVVLCRSERRGNGSIGFVVLMLLACQSAANTRHEVQEPNDPRGGSFQKPHGPGYPKLGLN